MSFDTLKIKYQIGLLLEQKFMLPDKKDTGLVHSRFTSTLEMFYIMHCH